VTLRVLRAGDAEVIGIYERHAVWLPRARKRLICS